jgi:hypothetical protein
MKKPKIVADLLAVADVCIEALEDQARLLDSWNKGSAKKEQYKDRDVNVAYRRNRMQQPTKQKKKRLFHRPADAGKWCKINLTTGHDLEECRTFLDHKKMLEKPVA